MMVLVLANEDKEWIATTMRESEERNIAAVSRVVTESENRTMGAVSRVVTESENRTMAAVSKVIRAAVSESEDRIMAAVSKVIRTAISESEQRTAGNITDMETKLLTEFHKWAGPTDQKLRTHREALPALDLEIEALAGRVTKLEEARDRLH